MTLASMTPVDSILARLLALHPKRIDLTLARIERILDRLGHPVFTSFDLATLPHCDLYPK